MADDKSEKKPATGHIQADKVESGHVRADKVEPGHVQASSPPQPTARRSATADAAEEIRRVGGTTKAQAEEAAAAGVDPKLDNRMGDQRPVKVKEPKPQQVSPDA